ncbi:MAG: hypothetical protein LBO66_05385 [Deltaproteobacteria bacterium]|jgi:hypothetical protein|nr:hypothetical protein [Deltaproteobacteria bacterium]
MTEDIQRDLDKIGELDNSRTVIFFDRAKFDWVDYREVIILTDDDKIRESVLNALTEIFKSDNSFLATAAIGGFHKAAGGFAAGDSIMNNDDFLPVQTIPIAGYQAHSRVLGAVKLDSKAQFEDHARDAAFLFAFFRRVLAKITAPRVTP